MMRNACIVVLFLAVAASAQVASPRDTRTTAPPPAQTHMAAQGPAIVTILPQLRQTIVNLRVNLARLRVAKWKAHSDVKQQAQSDIQSLDRNMVGALPVMISAVQANPNSLAAAFRLYRNLNVLFDVLAPVAESAGAYGDKDEYAALAQETRNLNQVRRTLADAVENMSAQRDAEFAALQRRATEEASAPPTKIIIDDNAPAPKKSTVRKKKTTPKK